VKAGGFIPGFVRASAPPAPPSYFPPPRIPPGWVPLRHPAPPPAQQQEQQGARSACRARSPLLCTLCLLCALSPCRAHYACCARAPPAAEPSAGRS
jgi:hypothetical protein